MDERPKLGYRDLELAVKKPILNLVDRARRRSSRVLLYPVRTKLDYLVKRSGGAAV